MVTLTNIQQQDFSEMQNRYDIRAGTNEIRRMLIGREIFKKIRKII